MNRIIFIVAFLFLFSTELLSQKYSISGNIKDADSGEDLISAVIEIKGAESIVITTNLYGYYSVTLEAGSYNILYSYVGYRTEEMSVNLSLDKTINIELASNSEKLQEATVTSEHENENISNNQMSVIKLNTKDIESIPVIFGEKDIIKVMQLTPGVQSAGEGNSGFYVRGGSADQNLIILDEAPVYNASHLLGFFSVFNSDAIKDVTLYKGGIPARYGGRGSSVMDIRMIDGNNKKMKVKGGVGLISSRLTIESPIVKNKGSFVISGRRTYADLFLKLAKNKELKNNRLYFYDITAKANYTLGSKDRVFFSGYIGRDDLKFGKEFGFDWGNKTATIRWNHIFGDKLFSNTSLIFSDYSYKIKITEDNQNLTLSSLIRDINLKQ